MEETFKCRQNKWGHELFGCGLPRLLFSLLLGLRSAMGNKYKGGNSRFYKLVVSSLRAEGVDGIDGGGSGGRDGGRGDGELFGSGLLFFATFWAT